MASFYAWPNFEDVPPMPVQLLGRKQIDGVKGNYPRHLCHLLEYEYIIALPDTDSTRAYLEWYSSTSNSLPVGIMLMDGKDFELTWEASVTQIETELESTGKPPVNWYLVSYIRGFDKSTQDWELDASTKRRAKGPWVTKSRMEDGALVGRPVKRVI